MTKICHEYQCEGCKGIFHEIQRDDELRRVEFANLFPQESHDDLVRLCHDCWLKLMEKAEVMGMVGPEWRTYV